MILPTPATRRSQPIGYDSARLLAVGATGSYCRVSFDKKRQAKLPRDQRKGSVKDQRGLNFEAALDLSWPSDDGRYIEYLEREGTGASRLSKGTRPEWDRLLFDLAACRLARILFWDTSRAARMMDTWVYFLDTCRALGVLIYSVEDEALYDVKNSSRDYKTLIDQGSANADASEKISKNVKRGKSAARREGRDPGRCCWGYWREYDPHTREFIQQHVNASAAPTILEVFTRYDAGIDIEKILRWLNASGAPAINPGKPWVRDQIRKLLRRPAYAALLRDPGTGDLLPGAWEAVVPRAVWDRVQARLDESARKRTKPGRRLHMLSGVMTCAECDGIVRVMTGRNGASPTQSRYTCRGEYCASVVKSIADEAIEGVVVAALSKPGAYDVIMKRDGNNSRKLLDEIKRLDNKLTSTAALFSRDAITEAQLETITADTLRDLAAARAAYALESVPNAFQGLLTPEPVTQIEMMRRWNERTPAQKKDACKALFVHIKLRPYVVGAGRSTVKNPDYIWDRIDFELRYQALA